MGALLDLALGHGEGAAERKTQAASRSLSCDFPRDGKTSATTAPRGYTAVSERGGDREGRIARARSMLSEVPTRRSAFIAGEERGGVIPVTVVIRTAHGPVTGELAVPKARWDPLLFLQFLRNQDERPSG
jgi:hypothetical protein